MPGRKHTQKKNCGKKFSKKRDIKKRWGKNETREFFLSSMKLLNPSVRITQGPFLSQVKPITPTPSEVSNRIRSWPLGQLLDLYWGAITNNHAPIKTKRISPQIWFLSRRSVNN